MLQRTNATTNECYNERMLQRTNASALPLIISNNTFYRLARYIFQDIHKPSIDTITEV
jgi:hypothetical protein